MKRLALIVAAGAAFLVASPASSQTMQDQSQSDLQCMAVALYMATQYGDAEDQAGFQAAMGSMSYFLGRLEGREPGVAWVSYFADHPEAYFDAVSNQANFQRCGAQIVALGAAMVEAGERMTAQGL